MSTIQHSAVTGADIHSVLAFTAVSTAARDALSVVAGDIGKVARVTADNSFYILTSISPSVWTPLASSASLLANPTITGGLTMTGSILPDTNVAYDLGSPTKQWHSLYVGPGSLYVNNQKVLQDNSGTIVFSADVNQNISIQTQGTGDVQIVPSGGIIALKGAVQIQAGFTLGTSDGSQLALANQLAVDSIISHTTNADLVLNGNGTGIVHVNDGLTVTGNLIVNGTTANLNVTNLVVQDNVIDIAASQISGTPTQNAGLRVLRGDSLAVQFRWNESSTHWEYTNDGATYLPLAAAYTLPTSSSTVLGGIKVGSGLAIDGSGVLSTVEGAEVASFNTRTGAVTLTSSDVTTALAFTPYNATNPTGYQTAAQVATAVTAGAYTLPTASTTVAGGVKVDGTTVTITAGVISAAAAGTSLATVVSTANTWTAGQRGAVVALSNAATVTPDFATSNNFSLSTTQNFTLAFPANVVAGQSGIIAITQDATGSRVITFASGYVAPGASKPVLTTTGNAVDYISYYVETSGRIFVSITSDVR